MTVTRGAKALEQGVVTPTRLVPGSISRPHYVGTWPKVKADRDDALLKSPEVLDRCGQLAASRLTRSSRLGNTSPRA